MQNDIEQPKDPLNINNIIKKMLGNKIILIALFIIFFIIFIIIIISAISSILKQNDNQVSTEETYSNCMYNGKEYKHDESFQASDSCNTCTCKNGEILCTVIECEDTTSQSATTQTSDDSSTKWETFNAENYSIKYPKDWFMEKGYSWDYGTIFSDQDKNSLTLTHYALPDAKMPKEIDTLEKLISFHYQLESSYYSRRDTEINGFESVIIGTTNKSTEPNTFIISYYIEKEKTDIWLLTVMSEEEDTTKRELVFKDMDYMVKSLRFK
jgi:hypothetical protein